MKLHEIHRHPECPVMFQKHVHGHEIRQLDAMQYYEHNGISLVVMYNKYLTNVSYTMTMLLMALIIVHNY